MSTAKPSVAEIPKTTAVFPLSWQPPTPRPVTKCEDCEYLDELWQMCELQGDFVFPYEHKRDSRLYMQNKDAITPSCPAWIEQKKEKVK